MKLFKNHMIYFVFFVLVFGFFLVIYSLIMAQVSLMPHLAKTLHIKENLSPTTVLEKQIFDWRTWAFVNVSSTFIALVYLNSSYERKTIKSDFTFGEVKSQKEPAQSVNSPNFGGVSW
jgi:hypothetical protein